ncbi:4'-phosphopantetheinyl transferase family protein [Marinibacterium profundimaris]|uniref:4'-phosphopantetheinyl transferase family protein n=1 Tax=Marinibacterium profundimaris TaxID=1679460 RepID=UPI000B51F58D|nr:4'-phosphopantetheinyl transferase superfamily protein [Marinibacterium profundimaris]
MAINVDLWLWNLDRQFQDLDALARPLTEAERRRSESFIKPVDRARFVAARGRLREILASYVDRPAHMLDFETVGRGKPVLREGPAFNLSHAGGWAALVVAPDAPRLQIGVDIEAIRPINPAVAVRSFSLVEQAELRQLLPAGWMRGFFNGWTRKEAVIKATGDGLAADLQSFDVTLMPDLPARMLDSRGPLPGAASWQIVNLDTGPGFCGAVAAITHGDPLGPIVLRQGRLPLLGTPLPAHGGVGSPSG